MIRYLLSLVFALMISAPISATVLPDTTATPVCDTIIDKNGTKSAVRIVEVNSVSVKFRLCGNLNKKIYSMLLSDVEKIISQSPKLNYAHESRVSLLKKLKNSVKLALVSSVILAISLLVVVGAFAGEGGNELALVALYAVFITPLIIVVSLVNAVTTLKQLEKNPSNNLE